MLAANGKPYRGWFGTFVENVVQGTARDLLAARSNASNLAAFRSCSTVTTKSRSRFRSGSLSDEEFLEILLKLPPGPTGLPLGGKVHSGSHYLEAPEQSGRAAGHAGSRRRRSLEEAIDAFIDDTRDDIGEIDDPALVEREDDEDYVANLADNVAPLTELVTLPLTVRQQGQLVRSTTTSSRRARSTPTISTASAAARTAAGSIG